MQRVVAFALGLALLAQPAAAQDMAWSTIIPSVTGTDILGMALRDKMAQAGPSTPAPRQPAGRTPPAAAASAPVSAAALTYRLSPARRKANLDNFVRKTRTESPAMADDLTKIFASGDLLDKLAAEIAPYGLKIDNLGDAMALYWIVAWQTSQGQNNDFDRATVAAVQDQTARALVEIRSIASANDAAKQEFAEALWVQAILLDGAVEQSKGDAAMLRMLGAKARRDAGQMGIDLATMTLTRQGFTPARG